MKAVKHVSSVTALAREIGHSRQWTQALMLLPDRPKSNGAGHDVAAWKKYVTRRADKKAGGGSERMRLQIELLKIRAERESHELAVSRDEVRERIRSDYHAKFHRAFDAFTSELRHMVGELSPRFAAMSARQIYSLWNLRQQEAFDRARLIFLGKEPGKKNAGKVIPFKEKAEAIA